MRRTLVLVAAFAAILPTAVLADSAQPILRNTARVHGDHVLLGDLFDNAGAHAGDEVASSPPPGSTLTLGASWLATTAAQHGLVWQAPSPLTTVHVERAAIAVETPEIAQRVTAALGLSGKEQTVVLDTSVKLYAPEGMAAKIGIEHLNFDRQTGRFTAEVRVPADDAAATPAKISGRVQTMVAVVVPTRNLNPGDLIAKSDLSTVWIRAELAPSNGVEDASALVGRTPRRPLRIDMPLRPNDAEVPVVVKRNDLVLMVMQQPGMSLTAQGKALEDGGTGSTIRVTNLQSNRIIQAIVTGAGEVAVQSPIQQPLVY